jgi:hypothetical protein
MNSTALTPDGVPTLVSPRQPRDTRTVTRRHWPPGLTIAVGAFYTCMAGVHIGIVTADPHEYSDFASQSPWGLIRTAWADIFMANPQFWGLFAAGLEIFLGVLLLVGGRPAKLGWVGVICFQFPLILFGWGYLWWSLPAATALFLAARHDWRLLSRRA